MPILLVLPVLITAASLTAIAVIRGRDATEALAWQNLTQIHREISTRVDELLRLPVRLNSMNDNLIRQGELDPRHIRDWGRTFWEEVRDAGDISSIVWGNPAGSALVVSRYTGENNCTFIIKDEKTAGLMEDYRMDGNGNVATKPIGAVPYDTHSRPWYRAGIKDNKPAWSEPYPWVRKAGTTKEVLGIAYSQSCRDANGQLLGVIGSELSLEDISAFLGKLGIGKTGLAFLVDQEGTLVACSTGAAVTDANHQTVRAWRAADTRIAAIAAYLKAIQASPADSTGSARRPVELAGTNYMIKVSRLASNTGLRWLIITAVPESDFLGPIHAAQWINLSVASIVVLLVIAFGLFLAKRMTAPILALTAHARKIGEGQLDDKIMLDQSPELFILSREMNAMTSDLRDRLRMRESLAMAMEVQQNLLPQDTPAVQGLDIAGHSTYCDETGGDYYDYLDLIGLTDHSIAVALGDVTGHGIAAAMIMATARGILRSHSQESQSLAGMLTHTNHLLARDNDERFMTMLLMLIDSDKKHLRWASAGHDMPFVYDPTADKFIDIDGGGLPLGILDDQEYQEYTLGDLQPGTVFLAATDGVWEACNLQNEEYGKTRVADVIRRHAALSAAEIGRHLREELTAFRGAATQKDDITFVVVKLL